MAGVVGFEPTTSGFGDRRSATELYPCTGAQSRNRTSDTRIFSPLLYQLSYLGIWVKIKMALIKAESKIAMAEKEGFEPSHPYSRSTPLAGEPLQPLEYFSVHCGGEGGIRTHAGFHPNGFQDRLVMTTSIPLRFW
jgi:hypothetical protein